MKIIGRMEDGAALTLIPAPELNALKNLVDGITFAVMGTTGLTSDGLDVSDGSKRASCKIKTSKPASISKGDRHKKCEICGDPFRDNSPRNQRKICTKQKCIKERKHQWQNAWLKNKNKGNKAIPPPAPRVANVNPFDPMLTDEERVKAARLSGIRARMP